VHGAVDNSFATTPSPSAELEHWGQGKRLRAAKTADMPSTRGYRRSRSLYEVWPPSNCDPGRGKQQDGGRWAPPQPRGAAGAQDPQVEGYPRPTRWAPYESCEDPESSCAGQCVGVGARRGGRTLLTTCHTGAAGKETACRGGPALHAIQLASAWSRASEQMHAHPDNSGTACRDSGTALDTSNTPLAESVPHSAQPQASSQFSEAVEA